MKIFFEKSLIYSVIAVYLFITVAPLVWVLSTSFKPNQEAISLPSKIFARPPDLGELFFCLDRLKTCFKPY